MLNLRKQHMKYWINEMPVGDPFGGPAFGQKTDPVSVFTAVASSVLVNAFSPSPSPAPAAAAPAPVVTPPTQMPTPGDANTKAAERVSISEQIRRRGRASTILTDQSVGTTDKLGA